MLYCPARGKASFPRASDRKGLLSMALRFHHAWFPRPPEVTLATDINTDPSCRWTTDPDMACHSRLGPDNVLSLGGRNNHSGRQTPPRPQVSVPNLDFYVTFGGNMGPGLQHRPQLVM